ncbi:probable hexosyltransferase MUCI70 isoform X2 [Mangifera indica]|uniref:probable hexosyltransferase MUCI70 isoform X2 n=1 Tax=Mangifera indica TaxID=29780 RepID=UPI001CFAC96D|nr:probable hexosyltransferase MUCI70 isoform X2 [Mangifera indica]XP_044489213.1 probable hexosyltransferase MUCI70 isoform X2 [Mangifera indica]XP_044489214.1 probable hexosyltransferase MUCI70 isoform X2 [Mangifera indica]
MLTDKRSEHVFRMVRRGRRFNRFYRQRLLRWVFFLAVLFFMCSAPFALKFFSRGNLESRAFNVQEGKKLTSGADKPRSNHTRRYFPCKIGFSESVTEVAGPMNFLNFSKFLLDYIELEDIPSTTNFFEPRFGGHQSLQEREKSFYAENQTLHCGFVKGPPQFPGTGFDFDEKDRTYMNNCEVVVSSCIFGSSDFLRRPTSRMINDFSKKNVCFVMFVDEQTLLTVSLEGNIPDNEGNIGLWRIVVVKNLPYKDMRRTGKVPKFLSHRLFPSARYSIWLDSKMRLQADPMLIIEFFLWRTSSEYAISNHYDRHCVWEEVLRNKLLNKYDHMAIDEQFLFYQSDGLTKFDPSDPNNLLPSYVPEGSFIVRAHTPMSNLFSCLWFNEVDRFTSRDQLSFAYTYLKLRRMNPQRPFYLNMFKDCERRQMTKLFKHRQLSPTSAT